VRTAHVVIDYKKGEIRYVSPISREELVIDDGLDAIELTRIFDGGTAHDPPRQCGPVPQVQRATTDD
jgi:hypothetical protein